MSKKALNWIVGDDTGISSRAIWTHMMGLPKVPEWAGNWPLDPSDFGRCYRLLGLMPAWRPRMGEMASYSKQWAALVAVWDELTALYEEEVPNHRGSAPKLYDRMHELLYPKESHGMTTPASPERAP